MKKSILSLGSLLAAGAVFAEGEANAVQSFATATQTTLVGYVTNTAIPAVTAVIAAGAAIVGIFYIWRVLKRSFSSSK